MSSVFNLLALTPGERIPRSCPYFLLIPCRLGQHGNGRAYWLIPGVSIHTLLVSPWWIGWDCTGLRGGATQANCDYLPLYDVGQLHLGFNGKAVTENFLSVPLSQCDIIRGESWLKANSGVADYAHGRLWQWTTMGIQRMSFDSLSLTRPDQRRETSDLPTQDTDTFDPLHTIVCGAIREGVKQASPPAHVVFITYGSVSQTATRNHTSCAYKYTRFRHRQYS